MVEFLTVIALLSLREEWSKIIISVKKTRYFGDYFQSIEGAREQRVSITSLDEFHPYLAKLSVLLFIKNVIKCSFP